MNRSPTFTSSLLGPWLPGSPFKGIIYRGFLFYPELLITPTKVDTGDSSGRSCFEYESEGFDAFKHLVTCERATSGLHVLDRITRFNITRSIQARDNRSSPGIVGKPTLSPFSLLMGA